MPEIGVLAAATKSIIEITHWILFSSQKYRLLAEWLNDINELRINGNQSVSSHKLLPLRTHDK